MNDLKTKPELLAALQRALTQRLSPETLHAQRVSFVMGSLKAGSTITRERVEREMARQEGNPSL